MARVPILRQDRVLMSKWMAMPSRTDTDPDHISTAFNSWDAPNGKRDDVSTACFHWAVYGVHETSSQKPDLNTRLLEQAWRVSFIFNQEESSMIEQYNLTVFEGAISVGISAFTSDEIILKRHLIAMEFIEYILREAPWSGINEHDMRDFVRMHMRIVPILPRMSFIRTLHMALEGVFDGGATSAETNQATSSRKLAMTFIEAYSQMREMTQSAASTAILFVRNCMSHGGHIPAVRKHCVPMAMTFMLFHKVFQTLCFLRLSLDDSYTNNENTTTKKLELSSDVFYVMQSSAIRRLYLEMAEVFQFPNLMSYIGALRSGLQSKIIQASPNPAVVQFHLLLGVLMSSDVFQQTLFNNITSAAVKDTMAYVNAMKKHPGNSEKWLTMLTWSYEDILVVTNCEKKFSIESDMPTFIPFQNDEAGYERGIRSFLIPNTFTFSTVDGEYAKIHRSVLPYDGVVAAAAADADAAAVTSANKGYILTSDTTTDRMSHVHTIVFPHVWCDVEDALVSVDTLNKKMFTIVITVVRSADEQAQEQLRIVRVAMFEKDNWEDENSSVGFALIRNTRGMYLFLEWPSEGWDNFVASYEFRGGVTATTEDAAATAAAVEA